MKSSLVLSIACLTVLVLIVAGCTSPPQGGTVSTVVPIITLLPTDATCGITSCHGTNLACGANPPQVCTADYQLGDKCRLYAFCDNSNGNCSLVTSPAFLNCTSCVAKCGGADPAEILSCEEKC